MTLSPLLLLKDRAAFWDRVRGRRLGGLDILSILLFIVLSCGLYGAVMAGWRSPRLSAYVAVKLPFLFLATAAVVSLFNWMIAAVLGSGLSYRLTVNAALGSMTVAAWILLSLAPVSLFFLLSGVPRLGTLDEQRFAHNCMLVTHILVLALAGIAGNGALLGGLRRIVSPRCPVTVLFVTWLAVFGLVGCQMAWILRPFIGSPYFPVAFMRSNALHSNFYESVFGDVLPYLLTGGE